MLTRNFLLPLMTLMSDSLRKFLLEEKIACVYLLTSLGGDITATTPKTGNYILHFIIVIQKHIPFVLLLASETAVPLDRPNVLGMTVLDLSKNIYRMHLLASRKFIV